MCCFMVLLQSLSEIDGFCLPLKAVVKKAEKRAEGHRFSICLCQLCFISYFIVNKVLIWRQKNCGHATEETSYIQSMFRVGAMFVWHFHAQVIKLQWHEQAQGNQAWYHSIVLIISALITGDTEISSN